MRPTLKILITLLGLTWCVSASAIQDDELLPADQKLRAILWEGDLSKITTLLKDKNPSELNGITIFMAAAATGDGTAVTFLVEKSEALTNYEPTKKTWVISKEQSPELDNLRNILGTSFDQMLSEYLNIKLHRGRYIRAETTCGYTALTYAVVGGWYDITEYIIQQVKERAGTQYVKELIDSKDCLNWTAMLYAVAYKNSSSGTESSDRLKILQLLIKNSGDTKVTGTFKEGDLDIISIAAKYDHSNVIQYLKILFEVTRKMGLNELIEQRFGTSIEIKTRLSTALGIAEKAEHKKSIDQLRAWIKEL